MENLPAIQTTLDQWLQLTSNNLLYVATITIGVWLFTAALYSLIIAGLNKKLAASQTAQTTAETNLNTAQQQLQQAQNDTLALTEQLAQQQKTVDAEKQRAANAEQQLAERNQQISAIIQRLANSFDIDEAPLLVIKDLKADDVWQQHDKVITKLIENLRTEQLAKTELQKFYQAEKDKVTATESRLQSLQANLDSQTNLVSTLQQQQNAAQQALADALQKQQIDLARLNQLEQRVPELERQLSQGTEKPAQAAVKPVETALTFSALSVQTTSVASSAPIDDSADKLKSLFKKPQAQPAVQEQIITEPEVTAQPEPIITDVLVTSVEDELVAVKEIIVEDNNEQAESQSVLKGWYGKLKGKKTETVEVEPAPQLISSEPVEEQTEKVSALKGFYKKVTAKSEAVESESVVLEETAEKTSSGSSLKGFYKKLTTKSEVAPEPVAESKPEVVVVEEQAEKISELNAVHQTITYQIEAEPEIQVAKPIVENTAKNQYHVSDIKLSDDMPSNRMEDLADNLTNAVDKIKKLFSKSE